MYSTAGYEVKAEAMWSALTVQTMDFHLHCESFGATVDEPTVEYSRERRCRHFGGSRLSGVDKANGSIHYDIRIDVEAFDEGVTMSARCRTGQSPADIERREKGVFNETKKL
jgi:hypothetical protein